VAYALTLDDLQLPWDSSATEDRRFHRILRNFLLAMLAVGLVMPFLPVPDIERSQQEALPPQLAQIVLERQELPVPPPPVVKQVEPKKPEPVKTVPKPKPKPEPKVVEPRPVPKAEVDKPKPKETVVQQAREKAQVSGILQFQDELADLRDAVDVASLSNTNVSRGQASAASVDRSVLTGRTSKTSGGIRTAALSKDTGGAALSGRKTTQVSSELATAVAASSQSRAAIGAAPGRSDEDIRKIMDRNKGAIFAIYNRALRKDPMLAGKLTVQLIIEPSGQVSAAKVLATELGDTDLEQKLLSRIRMINFGALPVASTTLNYSFEFLPYS
jgi:outer membrane biosynthesis protein TonB